MIRLLTAAVVALSLTGPAVAAETAACAVAPEPGRPFLKPENELEERLLVYSCKPTRENKVALGEALLRAKLYVHVDKEDIDRATGRFTTPTPRLLHIPLGDGQMALAIYSSKTTFTTAFNDGAEHAYAGAPAETVLPMTMGKAFTLNWGADPHIIFPAGFVRIDEDTKAEPAL
ncbi:MAG: SseB family protein [Caulobacter sp.]|nr:SseB family protein [Caulobacter sp.]